MDIIKRSGAFEKFDAQKIYNAIEKAFISVNQAYTPDKLWEITNEVKDNIISAHKETSVEEIQDLVEITLMKHEYFAVSKSYILYRQERRKKRQTIRNIAANLDQNEVIVAALNKIKRDYTDEKYNLEKLAEKAQSFLRPEMSFKEKLAMLIKAAAELTSQEAPLWEFIAGRLLYADFQIELENVEKKYNITNLYTKIKLLADKKLYGQYILEAYTEEEIAQAEKLIDNSRNELLNYSGLELLIKRYIIRDGSTVFETPQEMFLGIALHLAMKEEHNRLTWVENFYYMLSTLKVTMATPTLANSRKPFHQLSSCFIDTVPDSLTGIYRSIDNFAQVSKYGGGMGLYFGKVRANGSDIRGVRGAAGGVIRWIRLANDTAVAVDQLGVRQGAVAVYLDAWHKDLPEFLNLRTNNGDDRMKAHDVFPAVCYPDLFWETVKNDINADWYLMCPHDIYKARNYYLEDSWGEEWEKRYKECIADDNIPKRVVPIKDLVRLIIKSSVETGTPFAFYRDTVNRANPNPNSGMIYCSNLCTEIAQNMSDIKEVSRTIETQDGETVVVTVTKPGEFVVCNLASLTLGKIDVNSDELERLTGYAVRALDNVIDLNYFPTPYAKVNNHKYRPIGLGISGYHHMLALNKIQWESDEHLKFVDDIFERINYAAIEASMNTAKEKGKFELFEGSDWQTGEFFEKRNYSSEKWDKLRNDVKEHGVRNAWLMAIAPTSSTSIISGTTAGADPLMNKYFLEEKKNGLMPRVAPDLSPETYWYYKNAHQIDQSWSVKACGVRQRHIDQAQSMNLYVTSDYSFRQILDLYILAWESGVKTVYYIRSRSLEVDECESCSS